MFDSNLVSVSSDIEKDKTLSQDRLHFSNQKFDSDYIRSFGFVLDQFTYFELTFSIKSPYHILEKKEAMQVDSHNTSVAIVHFAEVIESLITKLLVNSIK